MLKDNDRLGALIIVCGLTEANINEKISLNQ